MLMLVCPECRVRYRAAICGVVVVSTMGYERDLYQLWRADLYRCACGQEVLTGFAARPFATHGDGTDLVATVRDLRDKGVPIYYEHEFPIVGGA